MRSNYLTLKTTASDEIIISKSRFIAHCARVETEEDAQNFIDAIKKEHRNATHNCSAYVIGEHDQIQKANDDGEPSGTAGVPILDVLKKQHLKDTVVVVTRYFGGIKLGAGGLVRAYGKTTTVGIDAAGVVERRLHDKLKISADYTWLGKLENELRNSTYILEHINYAEGVEFTVLVPVEETEAFYAWMTDLSNGQTQIKRVEQLFLEFDRT
ncbi:YigZ family protein [Kurthia massiliensis]|uniref:YigZ family protein n=1 Tax=Kurthia massiliensis TaxID=1033739 RepID=UPI000288232B|nr:YigZ family protein [Kurthia massiliensis]